MRTAKPPIYLCVFILLGVAACESRQENKDKGAVTRPVKIITLDAADDKRVSRFPGVIGADRLSDLNMQVGGLLQEFPVKEAQELDRGDLIAKLDQRDFQTAVSSAKAQYESAEKEFQRLLRLSEDGAVAMTTLDQKEAQRDVAKAEYDRAEKALADSVLRAPFKGVVAQTLVNKLDTVAAGQVLVKYMSDDTLEAKIDLPASFIANIPKEEADRRDRQAFVILDAAPNTMIEAEFKEASLLADTTSQTYSVTFSFRPPETMLILPGMNATVELRLGSGLKTARVSVPLDAVSSDGAETFVWIVDRQTMTVSRRNVSIEEGIGQTVVVNQGLNPGDAIVGAGASYLSEGLKIREWK